MCAKSPMRSPRNAHTKNGTRSTWPNMYGPPRDCKRKVRARESLRKCVRLVVEVEFLAMMSCARAVLISRAVVVNLFVQQVSDTPL
jgi:hypothetical protein